MMEDATELIAAVRREIAEEIDAAELRGTSLVVPRSTLQSWYDRLFAAGVELAGKVEA